MATNSGIRFLVEVGNAPPYAMRRLQAAVGQNRTSMDDIFLEIRSGYR